MENIDKILQRVKEEKESILEVNLKELIENANLKSPLEILDFVKDLSFLLQLKIKVFLTHIAIEKEEKEVEDEQIPQENTVVNEIIKKLQENYEKQNNSQKQEKTTKKKYSYKVLKDTFSQIQSFVEVQMPKISIEQQMQWVEEEVRKVGKITISELFLNKPLERIIVIFLALLELVKREILEVFQEAHFQEIYITLKN